MEENATESESAVYRLTPTVGTDVGGPPQPQPVESQGRADQDGTGRSGADFGLVALQTIDKQMRQDVVKAKKYSQSQPWPGSGYTQSQKI